jgi:hypothetical protein
MSYRNSLDCEGGAAPLVDKMLGTAFGVVNSVAQKLPVITYLQENIDRLVTDVHTSRDAAAASAVTSTQEAQASAGSAAASHDSQVAAAVSQDASHASEVAAGTSAAAAHASELAAAASAAAAGESSDASAASAAASQAAFNTVANGTSPDAGALSGTDKLPLSRGAGLLGTSLTKIAQWVTQTYQGFTQSGTGAVARTVPDRLRDSVSLRDFGAVGGAGLVDDTTALNVAIAVIQAMAAAQNSTYPLPAIDIPGGRYKLTGTINTYPWVKFRAVGSVVFDFSTLDPSMNGIVCRNEQTVIPEGLMKWGTNSPFLDGSGGSIMIQGPGKVASQGWAIVTGNTTLASGPVRDTGGCNVIVTGWRGALRIDPINCYLQKWKSCRFEQNREDCVYVSPASGNQTNSGERMLFEDVVFSGANNAVYHNCDGFDYQFVSCSFDYNGTPIKFGPNGRYSTVRLIGGHTEAFDGLFIDATASGQYVAAVLAGHDVLATPWTSGLPCSPSRTLIDGNPANPLRLSVDGLTMPFLVRPYVPDSAIVGDGVDIYSCGGVIFQSFYAPFSRTKSLGRDYDFSLDAVGTLATAMTAWFVDTTAFIQVSVPVADVQAAPGMAAGMQALHLNGTDAVNSQITIGTKALSPCSPGEPLYPGCDFYGGAATGVLNVRPFLRFYDAAGNLLSDSNTWFTYSMSAAYADAAVPTHGSQAQWFPTNYTVAFAPKKAAFFRTYVKVSAFSGDIYLRNVRAAFTSNRSAAAGTPAFTAAAGSIPFASGAGMLLSDNTNFVWDATNKRLGVGTKSPAAPLNTLVVGAGATTTATRVENYSNTAGTGVASEENASATYGAVGYRRITYSPTGSAVNRHKIQLNDGTGLKTVLDMRSDGVNGLMVGADGPNTSTLQSAGSLATVLPLYKLNATYALGPNDYCVLGDGATIFQLPAIATCPGRIYAIKNVGTGTSTITPNGAETIDGTAGNLVISVKNSAVMVQAAATGWQIIGKV